jgi:hypothetical protein
VESVIIVCEAGRCLVAAATQFAAGSAGRGGGGEQAEVGCNQLVQACAQVALLVWRLLQDDLLTDLLGGGGGVCVEGGGWGEGGAGRSRVVSVREALVERDRDLK